MIQIVPHKKAKISFWTKSVLGYFKCFYILIFFHLVLWKIPIFLNFFLKPCLMLCYDYVKLKKKSAAMTRSKYPMSASIYSNISAWHQNNQVIFSEILDTETDNKKRHLQYFIVILMPKIKYKHFFPLSSVNYCLKSFYYKTQFWGHV